MLSRTRNAIKAIFVRVCLVLHSLLIVWRAADVQKNDLFWLLALTNVAVVGEGLYRILKKKCQEGKWFTYCFLLYLASTLPSVWLLEYDRLDRYDSLLVATNISSIREEALSTISGVTIPLRLEPDTWLSLLEQSLLFILIIGRWLLPRGELTRGQLSQLLFVYLGIASDVMELFIIFEEPQIRGDRVLTVATFGVWSASLLQFCVVLTATKMTGRKGRSVAVADIDHVTPDDKKKSACEKFFATEVWSLILSIVLMDGPFLTVRLYALVAFKILSYGIVFFAFKNFLMICLLIYRLAVVCMTDCAELDDDDEDDDDGDEKDRTLKDKIELKNQNSNDSTTQSRPLSVQSLVDSQDTTKFKF